MKKTVCVLLVLALSLMIVGSLAEGVVSLPEDSYELFVKKAITLRPATDGSAGKLTYTWESDNPAVATVRKGKITAVAEGVAVITCTGSAKDGGTYTAQCTVSVTQPITGLEVASKASLPVGATYTPQVVIQPENVTRKDLEWESSNQTVLRVLPDGAMQALSVGSAKLTGKALDGSGKKVTINVTVPDVYVTHTKVVISKPEGVTFGYAFSQRNGAGIFIKHFEGDAVEFQELGEENGVTQVKLVPKKAGTATIELIAYGREKRLVRITVERSAIAK